MRSVDHAVGLGDGREVEGDPLVVTEGDSWNDGPFHILEGNTKRLAIAEILQRLLVQVNQNPQPVPFLEQVPLVVEDTPASNGKNTSTITQ